MVQDPPRFDICQTDVKTVFVILKIWVEVNFKSHFLFNTWYFYEYNMPYWCVSFSSNFQQIWKTTWPTVSSQVMFSNNEYKLKVLQILQPCFYLKWILKYQSVWETEFWGPKWFMHCSNIYNDGRIAIIELCFF